MLSRCVTQEWLQITEEVATTLGMQKAAESLTDVLILICEVTNTQGADNKPVFTALSYYLSNYGICIQVRPLIRLICYRLISDLVENARERYLPTIRSGDCKKYLPFD